MRPDELRAALFDKRAERPEPEDHTHVCLHCGSVEDSSCSACDEADSYFLPPAILSTLKELTDEMETSREEVLRGLLAVALASIERGGLATHTRAVVFLRDLEETGAAAAAPSPKPGPRRLTKREPARATSQV